LIVAVGSKSADNFTLRVNFVCK